MKLNCAGYPVDNFSVTYQRERKYLKATHLPARVREEISNRYGADRTRSNDAAPIATETEPPSGKSKVLEDNLATA